MKEVKAERRAPFPLQRLSLTVFSSEHNFYRTQVQRTRKPAQCSADLWPSVADNSSAYQLTLSTCWYGTEASLAFLRRHLSAGRGFGEKYNQPCESFIEEQGRPEQCFGRLIHKTNQNLHTAWNCWRKHHAEQRSTRHRGKYLQKLLPASCL